AAVFRNLLPKLEAGAGYVQTQPVFDLKTLRPAAEALRDASPSTRIVAMVMPLLSIEAAQRIEARLGVRLPERLCRDLDHGGAEAGWCAFGEVIGALACSPLVDGVAVMTFEMDPSPEVRQRIVAALGAAGALHEEGGGDGQPAPRLCDQPGRA
ncbi:MAG: methylenetetrahydrofolate reductase, partial [Dehalococcoidia bacterium]